MNKKYHKCPSCGSLAAKKRKLPVGFIYSETNCRTCRRRLVLREDYISNVISLDEHFDWVEKRPDPVDEVQGNAMRNQMLDYLREDDRKVALLMEEGYNNAEIAEKLEVDVNIVYVSVKRIRLRLKEFL